MIIVTMAKYPYTAIAILDDSNTLYKLMLLQCSYMVDSCR